MVNETFNPIPGTGHGGGDLVGAGAGQAGLGWKVIAKTAGTAAADAGKIIGKYNVYSGTVLIGWGVYQAAKSC